MFLATFIVILLTPWFWFAPVPKDLFIPEFKKDIQQARLDVVWERGKVPQNKFNPIFINWPTKFVAERLTFVMENLDITNYFFAGHPRERGGVEEKQKFFVFQFVLFIVGLTNKKIKRYKGFLIFSTLILLSSVFLFKWQTFEQTILLSIPFILVMGLGIHKTFSWPLKSKIILGLISMLEIGLFILIAFNK